MRRLRRAYQRNAGQEAKRRKKFKQRAIAAGTAAAITLGAGVSLNIALAHTPDIHELPVSQDADADLLADSEEVALGYRPFKPDQNRNEIPDGVELARRCANIINQLPEYKEGITETYRADHPCYGIELCDICGQQVNMCHVEITNPQLGLTVGVNYITLHYMEHGSFDYGGHSPSPPYEPVNTGRTDLQLLLRTLGLRFPYDPNAHQLPVDGDDFDGDLLTDREELKAGFNLYNPDQDNDLNPDGIELAKQCKVAIDQLPEFEFRAPPGLQEPYKIIYLLDGVGTCEICGFQAYMDYWEIVNPRLGLTIGVSVLDAHYMEHGSFSLQGGGRIDVPLLVKILEMPRRCGDLGTVYLPADLNEDCRVNFTDFIELADKWLESTDPNRDG